jgi:hypothetical protein
MEIMELVGLSLFELSPVAVKRLWGKMVGGRGRLTSEQYAKSIKDEITQTKHPCPLRVSIGTGDFVSPLIKRLFAEASLNGQKDMPRVSVIILKRLADDAATKMESLGILEPGFVEAMHANIRGLREDAHLRQAKVEVEERIWKHLPLFHGHVFANRLLIGPWVVGPKGFLHVRGPLIEIPRKGFEGEYERYLGLFDAV